MGRRFGSKMVIATTNDYRLVDLDFNPASESASANGAGSGAVSLLGLPISQTQESPSASVRPSIVTLSSAASTADRSRKVKKRGCEFLITSHADDQTLGVFIRSDTGEPTPKLIEWPSHPRSVIISEAHAFAEHVTGADAETGAGAGASSHVSIALLRNDTIEIHDLGSMQLLQRIELSDAFDPRFLSSGATTFLLDRKRSIDLAPTPDAHNTANPLQLVPLRSAPSPEPKVERSNEGSEAVAGRGNQHSSSSSSASTSVLVGGRDGLQHCPQSPCWRARRA